MYLYSQGDYESLSNELRDINWENKFNKVKPDEASILFQLICLKLKSPNNKQLLSVNTVDWSTNTIDNNVLINFRSITWSNNNINVRMRIYSLYKCRVSASTVIKNQVEFLPLYIRCFNAQGLVNKFLRLHDFLSSVHVDRGREYFCLHKTQSKYLRPI
jgi:hypothetical protein